MNNNDYYSQNQSGEKEEIRFDETDFRNPYSGYYREPQGNGFGADFKVYEEPSYATAPLIDEAKVKNHFSTIGMGYALFAAISFAASLVIQIIVYLINPEFYESTLFLNIVTPASLYLFALPVLLIVLSRCEAKAPEKKKMSFGAFILFLITAFGFMYIGAIIGNSVMETISNLVGHDYSNGLESIIDYENLWITAIFTVIVAPIGEEFVFRKLIIDRTQKYGGLVSIGLSGLMFGLMHGNLYQFFYCFALGLLLGYIYYSTGKLYITIAIHAIVNFVGSILSSLLVPVSEAMDAIDPNDMGAYLEFVEANIGPLLGLVAFSLFTYAAMACAVIFPIVFRKKLQIRPGEVTIPKGKIMSVVILNVGIIVMITLYLLEFGLNLLPL
ncbi:MAG: CPBP family intramembrane metalloprotease [Clostridia bacterium]|nr:CPBP family intramembrane metalloprotease [Clostridia bacterium]